MSDDPRRIAFVGDWHSNLTWAKYIMNSLAEQEVDAIVHVGDFGYWPRLSGGPDFLAAVASRAREKNCNMPVYFCDGNHEDHEWLESLAVDRKTGLRTVAPRVYHLPRGHRWCWNGVRFLALGGAVSVDKDWRVDGVSWFHQEEITYADLDHATAGGAEVDVLVTHDTMSFENGYTVPGISPPGMWPAERIQRSHVNQAGIASVVAEVHPVRMVHGHFHSRYTFEQTRDWGQLRVDGLDCDGTTLDGNVLIVDLDDLAADVVERREN